MNHWGWYWKYRVQHCPKRLVSSYALCSIDSFEMFKNPILVQLVKQSPNKISFEIPQYNLIVYLQDDNSLHVTHAQGSYVISVESKKPNYGGTYFFFHCPLCKKRMRKLYCLNGQYQCRKCANLGYASQRLRPSQRSLRNLIQVKYPLEFGKNFFDSKPERMHQQTFQRCRYKYLRIDEKHFKAMMQEMLQWYGNRAVPFVEEYMPPNEVFDLYYLRG